MKISIITTSFNSAATIGDTLRSVAQQTYPNVEHIIIDGDSTDQTLAIVQEFAHVAKVVSEPDGGIYDAMNKGIRMASGDVIGILNSDDFYVHHQVLEKIATCFSTEHIDSVYADLQFVDGQNTDKTTRTWLSGVFKKEKFLLGWMPPHPTFFVKKSIYEQYGGFNLVLKSAADYELMLRFLYKHAVSTRYFPEVIVKMRTGGQSTASLKNRIRANKEDRLAWALNGLNPRFYTFYLKPLLKIPQFFHRFR